MNDVRTAGYLTLRARLLRAEHKLLVWRTLAAALLLLNIAQLWM